MNDEQADDSSGDCMKSTRNRLWLALAVSLTQLCACTLGPDYVRPTTEAPLTFKEMAGWKMAQPRDQEIRGKWWEAFNDPILNTLEEDVNVSNQSLAQADATYRQAVALARSARAGLFPTVTADASATRIGGNAVRGSSASLASSTGTRAPVNIYSLQADASWEADIWGKVRRSVEASEANANASAADLESLRLSLRAQLAQSYFQLRALDVQQQLFERTIADYQKSVQLTQNQYAAGTVARGNVVLAQTQLQTTLAQATDIGVQRAQLEHAIAILTGKPASVFSIAPSPLIAAVPSVPLGMPSTLLERRPDIAAAERRVVAANAQIGVAKAAYFPDLTISATLGFQSSSFANWLTVPNRFWSIGPALAQTLFDAGARKAQTEQAIAAYDANVAAYRETVLTSFQEVEDNLAALRILEQEAQVQDEAVRLSRESVTLTTNQYKAGIVSFLEVIVVQTAALNNERAAVDIQNRRLAAYVLLIKALGGGWHVARASP
jgi:NodT family efflux transporter outer membrane factor (OMF) lipoprotein